MSKFQIIVADPPWSFGDGLKKMKGSKKRGAASQYPTMKLSDIENLNVADIADPTGCLLALWVPSSMLEHGMMALNNWGFTMKQTFVWVKVKKDAQRKEADLNRMTRIGMGRLFRQCHEIALIGTMGRIYPYLEDKAQRSVAFDLNAGHSIKPPTLQERLEIMFPKADKVELFARRGRPGWTVLGNQVQGGMDIVDAIDALAKQV